MRIDEPTYRDVERVAYFMRAHDVEELQAVYPVDGADAVAAHFLASYARRSDLMCAYADDEPVAVGMTVEARPNVITLGFIATERFPQVAAPLGRWIRTKLFAGFREAGCHRIECVTIEGYSDTHRWLKMLGLRLEATHPGYGKRGEAFHTFAWTADDVRSPRP